MPNMPPPAHGLRHKNHLHFFKPYLNFNGDINATFSKDPQNSISKADQNWPALNK
jgi:hypothetical protein